MRKERDGEVLSGQAQGGVCVPQHPTWLCSSSPHSVPMGEKGRWGSALALGGQNFLHQEMPGLLE